jgi:hypothetical protein
MIQEQESDEGSGAVGHHWTNAGKTQACVFVLSNKDGLKYTEIAAQLDISVNTVKTHIKLSYEFLRRECQSLMRTIIVIGIWIILLTGYGTGRKNKLG